MDTFQELRSVFSYIEAVCSLRVNAPKLTSLLILVAVDLQATTQQ